MRKFFPVSSVAILIGCASQGPMPQDNASPSAREDCRKSVEAAFSSRIVSPARGLTALCNVNGSMTACRSGAANASPAPGPMRPLTAHEEDTKRLLEECLAGKDWARE